MKIDIKRNSLIIIPENEQDRAFIEDTLGLKDDETTLEIKRVNDVSLGFHTEDRFVLKLGKE